MLSASEQVERKVQEVYDQHPDVTGPSHIPYKRSIHPKRRAKRTYLVAGVNAQDHPGGRPGPHFYLLPVSDRSGNAVMHTREILEDAVHECAGVTEICRVFNQGFWVEYRDELESALPPQPMTLLDKEVSSFETFEMHDCSLITRKAAQPKDDPDIFCRVEATTDKDLTVQTNEFKPFQASPITSNPLTE